jgi:hypothetical protein
MSKLIMPKRGKAEFTFAVSPLYDLSPHGKDFGSAKNFA